MLKFIFNQLLLHNFEYLKNEKSFLIEIRKATGFKSLRLNCSDITQVNIKMQNANYC